MVRMDRLAAGERAESDFRRAGVGDGHAEPSARPQQAPAADQERLGVGDVLEHLAGYHQRVAAELGLRHLSRDVGEHEARAGHPLPQQLQPGIVDVEAGHRGDAHQPLVQQDPGGDQIGGVWAVGTSEVGHLPGRGRAQLLQPGAAALHQRHPQALGGVHLRRAGRRRRH